MTLREVIRALVPNFLFETRALYRGSRPIAKRSCPICLYEGYFRRFGRPPRLDARCPACGSLERHRLFWLWFKENTEMLASPVLHFAPEKILQDKLKVIFTEYRTADIFHEADLRLNIEKIDVDTSTVKTVICNHVLEHVDDKKALAEIARILTADGVLICSVPIIEGWEKTYENPNAKSDFERELHFGQYDHVRCYGRDFRDRLRAAGFNKIEECTAAGEEVVRHGLLRGEKIFICSKN
jgi:SAM-dependent methyltransferase